MIRLILILVILLFSVWLGLEIHNDPGYIMISYQHWSIETSLWVALVILVLLFIVFYGIFRLIDHTSNLTTKVKGWKGERLGQKSLEKTQKGIRQLAEGNWALAEKDLSSSASKSQNPLLNYLAAARAAQAQQAYDRRDIYIRKAYECNKKDDLPVGITQAQLQYESGQHEQALATLNYLLSQSPKHPQVLKQLSDVYFALKEWGKLQDLLPKLRKHKAISSSAYEKLEQHLYEEMLHSAADTGDAESLHHAWESIPRAWRNSPEVITHYTTYLIQTGTGDRAVPIIEKTLKKHWIPQLIKNYGLAYSTKVHKQISTAEGWLKKNPNDPDLLLTLARLCKHEKLWGQAKEYLEACAKLSRNALVHQELGETLEQLGEHDAALEQYRKGLNQVNSHGGNTHHLPKHEND